MSKKYRLGLAIITDSEPALVRRDWKQKLQATCSTSDEADHLIDCLSVQAVCTKRHTPLPFLEDLSSDSHSLVMGIPRHPHFSDLLFSYNSFTFTEASVFVLVSVLVLCPLIKHSLLVPIIFKN